MATAEEDEDWIVAEKGKKIIQQVTNRIKGVSGPDNRCFQKSNKAGKEVQLRAKRPFARVFAHFEA